MPASQFFFRSLASCLLAPVVLLCLPSVAQTAGEPSQPQSDAEGQHASQVSTANAPSGDEPLTTEQIEQSLGRDTDAQGSWVDDSHEYIGTKADDLAIYLDRFFGSPIEDLESADSTVRFTTRFQYDEEDGHEVKFRLRGNVHFPRINNRLSLVFNGEDDDFRADGLPNNDDENNQIGLQLKAAQSERSRFDLTLSASKSLDIRPGVRYRFKDELGDWGRARYTGRADYSDKYRFRLRHTGELDYLTGETSLMRLAVKAEKGQRSEGVEWGTELSWIYGYSIDSAMSFSIGANGRTEPEFPEFLLEDPSFTGEITEQDALVSSYHVNAHFRNRLYKDWLYIEFEPGYSLRKLNHFEDRRGVLYARVNFEIWFNRGRVSKKKPPDKDSESSPPEDRIAGSF